MTAATLRRTVSAMTAAEFERIDKALAYVIENPGEFNDFTVDFAMSNADRLERFGVRTRFSAKQMNWISRIERAIAQIEEPA